MLQLQPHSLVRVNDQQYDVRYVEVVAYRLDRVRIVYVYQPSRLHGAGAGAQAQAQARYVHVRTEMYAGQYAAFSRREEDTVVPDESRDMQ